MRGHGFFPVAIVLFLGTVANEEVLYEVIDLRGPSEPISVAKSVNNSEQMVGVACLGPNHHTTLFDSTGLGNKIDLLELESEALWISNAGQVVGQALFTSSNRYRVTIFDSTGGDDNLKLDGDYSEAVAVNDFGQIVGNNMSLGKWYPMFFELTGGGNNVSLDPLGQEYAG